MIRRAGFDFVLRELLRDNVRVADHPDTIARASGSYAGAGVAARVGAGAAPVFAKTTRLNSVELGNGGHTPSVTQLCCDSILALALSRSGRLLEGITRRPLLRLSAHRIARPAGIGRPSKARATHSFPTPQFPDRSGRARPARLHHGQGVGRMW